MFLFFEPSLVQKKVLEGLKRLGDTFNKNKTLELHNSEILKSKKGNKNFFFKKIFELLNSVFLVSFFYCKVLELRKISYDVTI